MKAALTNLITSSAAVFDDVRATNVNGTFLDADSSDITMRYSAFDAFLSAEGYLLQSEDGSSFVLEHSSFANYSTSAVFSATSEHSIMARNNTFSSGTTTKAQMDSTTLNRRALDIKTSTAEITNNTIVGNTAEQGGAILISNAEATVEKNFFSENMATKGGALAFLCDARLSCSLSLTNNTFEAN